MNSLWYWVSFSVNITNFKQDYIYPTYTHRVLYVYRYTELEINWKILWGKLIIPKGLFLI